MRAGQVGERDINSLAGLLVLAVLDTPLSRWMPFFVYD